MNDQRERLIEEIFVEAADLPRDARGEYLRRRCSGDSSLRREVEALLEHDERAGETFLDGAAAMKPPPAADDAPMILGQYRVVRQLGVGGMGVVYEAQQENPRRSVALKVVRPGMISRQVLRRFEYETQILAQLKHPGIAQIFEAGEFIEDGQRRPYFAMELIVGEPLDRYCRRRSIDVRGRLDLIARICDAVDHAHSRGVVHRDLKPGNIFVDESGCPKILDFGVSRLASRTADVTTLVTSAGQIIGTLPYMSPEQVSGDSSRIDARSDVYSLGAVTYELLSGKLPLGVSDLPIAEAARVIREEDPTMLGRISPVFRGDVETIVGKALNKEQDLRYGSAAALAADIRRFLRHEPIVARPTGAFDQLRKFTRRNTGLATGFGAALVILVIGVVAASYLAIGQARQRERAERLTLEANENTARAMRLAYKTSISAAMSAAQTGDAPGLRRILAAVPESLRNWEWKYLDHFADRSIARTEARLSKFISMAVADDGAIYMLLENDEIARWDGASQPRTIYKSPDPVNSITVSRDGDSILVIGPGKVVCIDAQGTQRWSANGTFGFAGEAFNADGSTVILADRVDGRAVLIDAASGARRAAFGPPVPGLLGAGHSPGGRHVIMLRDYTFEVFDAQTERVVKTIQSTSFALSPDDAVSVHVAAPRSAQVVELASGRVIGEVTATGGGSVSEWLVSEWFIVAIEQTGAMSVFDRRSLMPIDRILVAGPASKAYFLRGGTRIVVASADDPVIRIFDLTAGSMPLVINDGADRVDGAAISPSGDSIVAGGWGTISFWDPKHGIRTKTKVVTDEWLDGIALSPGTGRVAALTRGGSVVLCEADAFRLITDPGIVGEQKPSDVPIAVWTERRRRLFCWIDDRHIAFPAVGDDLVLITAGPTQTPGLDDIRRITLPARATCVVPTRTPGVVAVGTQAGSFVTLDATGAIGRPTLAESSPIVHLAFSKDGSRIATVTTEGVLSVHDAATGTRLATGALRSKARSVSWSPDGTRLALGCDGYTTAVADPATAETLIELKSEGGSAAYGITFTADGSDIVALGSPYAMTLYETSHIAPESSRLARFLNQRAVSIVSLARRDSLKIGEELTAELMSDATLPIELREAAVAVARGEGDIPRWTNSIAWGVAVRSDATPDEYRRSIKLAESVHRAFPNNSGYLNTLGVLLMRAGRYDDAIDVLIRCDEVHRRENGGSHPLDLIPLAMSYQRSGRTDRALAVKAAVAKLMAEPRYANDQDCIRFATELRLDMGE